MNELFKSYAFMCVLSIPNISKYYRSDDMIIEIGVTTRSLGQPCDGLFKRYRSMVRLIIR